MNFIDTRSTGDRFGETLDLLCRAVAGRIAGLAMTAAMIVLVWRRVKRVQSRIQALLVRFRSGRLQMRTGARSAPRSGGRGARGRAGAGLPVRFGWLLPLVPGEAACYAGQVRTVLAEAEMVALLAASPQARRVLRPLCRMLGIEAAALAPAGVGAGSADLGVIAVCDARDGVAERLGFGAADVAGSDDPPDSLGASERLMQTASGRCRDGPDG